MKMFSPEQVSALTHMFEKVIDNYSNSDLGNQQGDASECLGNDLA